jgi:hypothetical protein
MTLGAPTVEELSLQEACREYRHFSKELDDHMSVRRAQRSLDRIITRCQSDKSLPDPFDYFVRGPAKNKMVGDMQWDVRHFDSFIDKVERELERRQRSVVGI